MSRIGMFFLFVITPALAIVLAVLGVETIHTNLLGWFLLSVGVAYISGMVIVYWIRKEHFWGAPLDRAIAQQERGDRSNWLITAGMLTAFYLPPLEYLFFVGTLPRANWMSPSGVALAFLGASLFIWAWFTFRANFSENGSAKPEKTLVQSGPYRFIRHPAYLSYLLMALGVSLGYSSLSGLAAIPVLLLPGVIYQMKVEENMLTDHLGEQYRQYMRTTKRLIPGVW